MIIKNFLRATAAIAVSCLCVFAMTSGHVPTSKHYKAVAQLFAPAK